MAETKTYNIGTIETAQFFNQSLDYQDLTQKIEDKALILTLLPETEQVKRLKVSKELEELEQQKEQLKENVFRLYETFTKIKIDTERLAQAKAYFDQGEFRE